MPFDPTASPDTATHGYHASKGSRWPAMLIVAAIHCVGFLLLGYLDILPATRAHQRTLIVNLFELAPPPPVKAPPVADLPADRIVASPPAEPIAAIAPPRVIETVVREAPPITTRPSAVAMPTLAPSPAPSPASAPLAKPIEPIADLDARLLTATPPRYPVESRRRHETGVVVLMVEVGMDGRVSAISVTRSSGHERLDQAALHAVRAWRWSPTFIEGRATTLRGLVRIPFMLAA